MKLTDLQKEIDSFNQKLKAIDAALCEVLKLKQPLQLNISNCQQKDEFIIITHPNIKTQLIKEDCIDDIQTLKTSIIENIKKQEKEKRIYDIEWEINYWTNQLSESHLNNRRNYLEELIKKLETIKKEE